MPGIPINLEITPEYPSADRRVYADQLSFNLNGRTTIGELSNEEFCEVIRLAGRV